jgi:hypothetical protein
MTRKGELFLKMRGSSKSIGAFQKFSTTSLCWRPSWLNSSYI